MPLPFYGQLPYGYQPSGQVSSSSADGTDSSSSKPASASSGPTGIIDIRSNRSGTFTAAAGDLYSLRHLYTATAPTGSSIAGYKVALRSDQAPPNSGQLLLGDKDVTGQLSFTADEFSRLHFKAGPSGSQQDLVVVAQLGTRPLNGIGALLTRAIGSDASFVNTAQEASIFIGFGKARPGLRTVGTPYDPQVAATLLANLVGRFQSTQTVANGAAPATTLPLNPRYAGAIAASLTAGSATAGSAQGTAPWLLDPSDPGSYQTGGAGLALQKFAVAAYQASQKA